MPHLISHQSYGKCKVRLTKVVREGDRHTLIELIVDIALDGDFASAYMMADNHLIIPTDTMKNTVYTLAKQHNFNCIERFGQILAKHFVDTFDHVRRATVHVSEHPWRRISVDGTGHRHAFMDAGNERCTAVVTIDQSSLSIVSGLDGLAVLKTAQSGFSDFLKDQFTTLEDATDRIFATTITAEWNCDEHHADWNPSRQTIRGKLLEVFATHDSKSVQHTLYTMATAVLDTCEFVQSMTLKMPNQHRLLVNLEPFGLDNPNEIFVPLDEPYGMICATIERE